MIAQEYLDHALGLLEGDDAGRVEQTLRADPAAADRAARLARALDLLVGEADEPPAGLADRTHARLAERLKRVPAVEAAPGRIPFGWADVAVAAGIFLAAMAVLIPAAQRSRSRAAVLACGDNLRQIGIGLAQYSGAFGVYPQPEPRGNAPYAGAFALILNDKGLLQSTSLLNCPGTAPRANLAALPRYADLCKDAAAGPAPCLHEVDYGYNLGGSPDGLPASIPASVGGEFALLSDRPAHASRLVKAGNSDNHGGSGQNVLYAGGHVAWHPTRRLGPGDADMFLNDRNLPAPGLRPDDVVFAPATFRVDGR